jgi:hypothetical protein
VKTKKALRATIFNSKKGHFFSDSAVLLLKLAEQTPSSIHENIANKQVIFSPAARCWVLQLQDQFIHENVANG